MKTWIYSWLVYPFAYSLAMIFSVFSRKARETLRLRTWKDFLSLRFNVGQPIEYWVHVASSGELEYAFPILQELSARQKRVLLTYYSISAKTPVEQLPQKLSNVSLVVPLPHDGLGLMKEFVMLARKQGVRYLLLMRYELWPGLLWECNRRGIKVLLVDAHKPSWFHRKLLHKLDGILSGYPTEVLGVSHRNIQVVGDTRVERVLQRVEKSKQKIDEVVVPKTLKALQCSPVLICGSMWPPDTKLVFEGLKTFKKQGGDRINVVWVPHELDESEGRHAAAGLAAMGYKVQNIDDPEDAVSILPGEAIAVIVMKKGFLVELYRLGVAAWVGGGFNKGVHSVWEPALAGLRVACGSFTERSPEAEELAKRGLLDRVTTPEQFATWLKAVLETQEAEGVKIKISELLQLHAGAARRVVDACERM